MTWQEARQVAAEWLVSVGYPKRVDVTGLAVDLRPHLDSLKTSAATRDMVLGAAARVLRSHGASFVILQDADAEE